MTWILLIFEPWPLSCRDHLYRRPSHSIKEEYFLSCGVEWLHFLKTIQKCYIIQCVFWHFKKFVTQKALEIIWYGTAKGITGRIWNSINLGAFVKIYCCVSSLGCSNQTPASVACSWYLWQMIGSVIYQYFLNGSTTAMSLQKIYRRRYL